MLDLFPFQERAVASVLNRWANEAKGGCLVAPTAAGKTAIAAGVARVGLSYGKRGLLLTHTRDLVVQSARALARYLDIPVGIVMAGHPTTESPLQVASLQTLIERGVRPPADFVFHDECHHMAATEFGAVAHDYRGALQLGMTATPERSDGLPLGDRYRWLVVAADYSELLALGRLVPCHVYRPQGLLKGLADDPVSAYLQWGQGRSGFVYVKTVPEARALALAFTARGIPAACVDFESPDRDERIADLREGRLRLLVNVYTLTEGVDVPSASLCMLARGVGHVSIFLQMVGRVLRAHPGKTDALVLDLPGVTHDFGLPTEDRDYALTGDGIRRRIGAPPVKVCQKCGLSFLAQTECPRCGFRLPEKKVRVYGVPLTLAEASAMPEETKRDEWARIQATAAARGYSDAWAIRVYREKFGERPVRFSEERRMAEYQALKAKAVEMGYSVGWAAYRYKATYGAMPPRQW